MTEKDNNQNRQWEGQIFIGFLAIIIMFALLGGGWALYDKIRGK